MTTNKQIKRHDDDDDDAQERGAEERREESDTTSKKTKITGECSILVVQGRFHCCFEVFDKCLTEIKCSQTE